MTRLPRMKGKDLLRALCRAGFQIQRTRGSHTYTYLKHPDGRATVVPVHSGETIGPGLMAAILRDVEMSAEQFLEFA
jgi:predicted RNA binding protein YcfA (HicA-like mRNA interferase family)